jgi:hypothetical protein
MKMQRELTLHLSLLVGYFALIIVFKKWFDLTYIQFLLGGVLGFLLPDIDNFIYVYFVNPGDSYSQEVRQSIGQKNYKKVFENLSNTRGKDVYLIFHTSLFQIIFLALTFLVVTSSGSILGRGIVLAFALHLLVDQYIDFRTTGTIDKWFKKAGVILNRDWQFRYMGIYAFALLVMGFVL